MLLPFDDRLHFKPKTVDSKMRLILYSKPGCHLCEGLQEKLEDIQADPESSCRFDLEIRDITTNEQWWQAYQYEVPVLCRVMDTDTVAETSETPIPRPSPRLSVEQLEQMLQKYL